MNGDRVITDPIEKIVADALDRAGIQYACGGDEPNCNGLDFYLKGRDTFIECKAYHTPRITEQMSRASNVIAIQGRKAAEVFAEILAAAHAGAARDAAVEAARAYRTAESDDTPRMFRGKALQDLANDLDDKLEAVAQAGVTEWRRPAGAS